MAVLVVASLGLAVFGLVYLKDARADFHRGSRATLAVAAIALSILAGAEFGAIAAVLVLAVFAALAVWRLRS